MAFRVPRSASPLAEAVTSEAVSERKYRHVLEHPSDKSGPTVGIGYDFGTQTKLHPVRLEGCRCCE
ncbi:hypothetical protein ABIA99_007619 [Bradyrhizobium sp. LB12.1]